MTMELQNDAKSKFYNRNEEYITYKNNNFLTKKPQQLHNFMYFLKSYI